MLILASRSWGLQSVKMVKEEHAADFDVPHTLCLGQINADEHGSIQKVVQSQARDYRPVFVQSSSWLRLLVDLEVDVYNSQSCLAAQVHRLG